MKYTIRLRHTSTGETKDHECPVDWDDEHMMLFNWFENNFACDCNRMMILCDDDDTDFPCGHEAVAIDWIKREDGSMVDISEW